MDTGAKTGITQAAIPMLQILSNYLLQCSKVRDFQESIRSLSLVSRPVQDLKYYGPCIKKNNCFTLLRANWKVNIAPRYIVAQSTDMLFYLGIFAMQEYLEVINTTFVLLIALKENKHIPFPTITHLILLLSSSRRNVNRINLATGVTF